MPSSLSVSIVVFHPDASWLERTLASLMAALRHAHESGRLGTAEVMLVDNQSATADSPFVPVLANYVDVTDRAWLRAQVLAGHGNVGYGAGNNLAIERTAADFHLVINPDVTIAADAIDAALAHLETHAACAMVTPVATSPAGMPLRLVKGYPNVMTLLLRGFAPAWVRNGFADYLARYERGDVAFDAPLTDARVVSGCFMLIRRNALVRAKGFDPAFFLYFEDFDLSWRISGFARIDRVPACRIVHGGGEAARKGIRHIGMFVRSAARFFNKHGWRGF